MRRSYNRKSDVLHWPSRVRADIDLEATTAREILAVACWHPDLEVRLRARRASSRTHTGRFAIWIMNMEDDGKQRK